MKTFAYLALIGSAMAVRLMEDAAPTVEDAATMDEIAGLKLEDLEREQEGLGECFGKKTREALEEVELSDREIAELSDELAEGAEQGKTLGDAVKLLRKKAEEHDVDAEGQEEFLGRVLKKVKGCKRELRGEGSGSGSDGDATASVEEVELAQEGEEEASDDIDLEDAAEFAREAKAAFDELDSDEQDEVVEEVKRALKGKADKVVEAMQEGAEEALKAAYDELDDDQKEMLAEGVRAVKEHKARKEAEGESDGEGDEEGPQGPRGKKDE